MKRLFLLLVYVISASVLHAEVVTEQQALQKALQFVTQPSSHPNLGRRVSKESTTIVYTHKMPRSKRTAFYIVNVGDDAFVIVSADDVAHQVLGYSFNKNFPVGADGTLQLPPHVKSFFDDLAAQMEAAIDGKTSGAMAFKRANSRRTRNNLPASIDPLITTTWDQGQYYNALCPEDANGPDGHVWAGCIATAMAQIVKYWGTPTQGRGIHGYNSNYGWLEVNFENSNFNYAIMPDALTAESSEAQVDAVASLVYQCGVACNMSYGAGESSSYDVDARAGLINFFRFSPDMNFAEKEFFTDDEWNSLIRENLAANHPIIYSGQSGNGGHTFICDGYKADDYYHFNFGWGGFCDGWYLTSAVDVNSSSYNSSQSALVDIVPDNNCNVILGQKKGNSTFTVNEPLEFFNLMGNNAYEGNNYGNPCDNTVTFLPADETKQMVADVMEFEDQTVNIYNGAGTSELLRTLTGGSENDLSPVVSTANALTLKYTGNMFYAGFKITASQDKGLRMVSNIASSVDNTTIHLTWTENGSATQWQIEYGVKDFELGSGTVYNATENTVTFENLQKFTEYDFYIRSVIGNEHSQWNKITLMVEAPYWQDVVTSQPEGYVVNEETNTVEISTAKALAWWAKSNCPYTAYIASDIDLSAYKWKPVNSGSSLFGQGHVLSNIYIHELNNNAGFFTVIPRDIVIADIGLENIHVIGKGFSTGGLCGESSGTIRNCYIKNGIIDGGDMTGGLAGKISNGTVINCFVNIYTSGSRWTSQLIGSMRSGNIRNCYAAGRFRQRAYCYNGGIVAYSDGGTISNCYSVEMPMGVVGYKGGTIITDTATFVKTDAGLTLLTPAVFDEQHVTDLLVALNQWVGQYNDADINTWTPGQNNVNGGYPVFGSKHVIQCPNVSHVTIKNIKTGNKNEVSIGWTENGTATQWEIRYRRYDVPGATYTYIMATSNPTTIQDIPLGFVYEFNVRSIGKGELKSGWSETQYAIVDLPYWTDIVTEQPSGYTEDTDGNVTISTTEGLAWLAVKVGGLNGQYYNTFEDKTVTLTADINLEGYRWYPIGGMNNGVFSGMFDGQGHSVSNIYINDSNSDKGLFGYVCYGSIKNVNILGGYVASIFSFMDQETHYNPSSAIGGLVGYAYDCLEITNCSSSVNVFGNEYIGSLCGGVYCMSGGETLISNCSASGTVFGREACGDLIGYIYGQIIVRNSFATGDVNIKQGSINPLYRGGLIGYSNYSTIDNCYSTGMVHIDTENSGYYGKVIGCPEETRIHYLYGQDNVNPEMELVGYSGENLSNSALFHHDGNENTLLSSVSVSGKDYSDMTEALNAWVTMQNDPGLRTWTLDLETGYPVFGDEFVPSCYNPTDLIASNATTVGDATIRTALSWNQTGEPTGWEVLYVAAEHDVGEGTIIPVTSNPCVLTDIPVGKPLDFYVRAVNSEADKSCWSKQVTYIPDKLHWTEVVTSQPEGYREDSEGNVYISSAEGLAWLSSVTNGLNGAQQPDLWGKGLYIMTDIDLSSYRWTPIRLGYCKVNGNNHTISGLYCNELADYMGLIGEFSSGIISNLNIYQCNVYGENRVGALIGFSGVDIDNCSVTGNVYGIQGVGGLVGEHTGHHIANCSYIGNVSARNDITKANTFPGYIGAICGNLNGDAIVNCYVACEVPDDAEYSGIIVGVGGYYSSILISNCYYKDYQTTLSLISNGFTTIDNSNFAGSGSTWTLSTPPYVNGSFRTDLLDALNAWVDANNANGTYNRWVEDTENVNGGFPIFAQRHFDVGDVVNVINFTMNEDATPDDVAMYDMNYDLELNIGDIILVVKTVLNQTDNEDNRAREFVDLTQYSAVQFEVRVPKGTQVNDIRLVNSMTKSHQMMCLQTGADTFAVVVYSMSNKLLAPENGNLIELYMAGESTEQLEIENMKAAKPSGETVRCKTQADVTAIKVVENREKSEGVYDLKGIRHNDTPRNGLYIINGKKVVVK